MNISFRLGNHNNKTEQLCNGKGKVNMNRKIRRNRKNNLKRERIIMLTSSAFVLAALTMTGIYFKDQNAESQDDGYTIDFAALEDSADDKVNEIAQSQWEDAELTAQGDSTDDAVGTQVAQADTNVQGDATRDMLNDIAMNIGEGESSLQEDASLEGEVSATAGNSAIAITGEDAEVEASSGQVEVARTLHYSEEDGLVRPISGDILMHYSMDASIYFATLDQYKYNPATIFTAEEGASVTACAEGKVKDIYSNAELGNIVVLDLGDGYLATYGQLKNIKVEEGEYVKAGDVLGSVAAPTKYYSIEGTNLYFQMAKDGVAVNAEDLFE